MDDTMLKIAKQFDKNAASIEFFTECRNLIYKVGCQGYSFILRLINQENRSKGQIESELDFQNYLFCNGADVVQPLLTEFGESCLSLDMNNHRYWVSAFKYANGKNWYERTDSSEETLQRIGKALGKIHQLSKVYSPTKVVKRRLWNEQQELIKAETLFKNYNTELYNKFIDYIRKMDATEKSSSNFGLTHGDYLMSNYLIDDSNNITIIDFDECEYSWYVADLAICMRCYLTGDDPLKVSQKTTETEMIHYNLLLGYKSEKPIDEEMVFGLDRYIRIRDFIEISQLLELISQGKLLNNVENKLLDTCFDRVMNNKPFLDFDTIRVKQIL